MLYFRMSDHGPSFLDSPAIQVQEYFEVKTRVPNPQFGPNDDLAEIFEIWSQDILNCNGENACSGSEGPVGCLENSNPRIDIE